MNRERPRNVSHSVRDRLLTVAKERQEEFQSTLTRYAVERLLFRLSASPHRGRFILKGAFLFETWAGEPYRPTRDVDFLGIGSADPARLVEAFREVCAMDATDDGILFDGPSVAARTIREGERYQGVRITLRAHLGAALIPVQIDVGHGDAVTPRAVDEELSVLLDFPRPRLLIYPKETVIAEKCEALVDLGLLNSRLKDFYDLWYLARRFDFTGPPLAAALAATFARRRTPVPLDTPLALTPTFADDARKKQWEGFLRKIRAPEPRPSLESALQVLGGFLVPPLSAVARRQSWTRVWRSDPGRWI